MEMVKEQYAFVSLRQMLRKMVRVEKNHLCPNDHLHLGWDSFPIDIGGREDDLEPALGNSNKLKVKLKRKLQQERHKERPPSK